MDFDDPDDITTDRESNAASRIIDPADDGKPSADSTLMVSPSQAMVESLCDQIADVQDVYCLKAALRYCIHFVTLYDYNTVKRILVLPERREETVPFPTEEDKRLAGGGA